MKTSRELEKRRLKKLERRASKRKEKTKQIQIAKLEAGKKKSFTLPQEMFPEDQLIFWLAHGVNYLISDYDKGLWNPLFETIYEGKLPSPQELSQAVLSRYADVTDWPIEAKAVMAWTVTDRAIVYVYSKEILRRIQLAHPEIENPEEEARQPHQAQVWEVFKMLKDKLSTRKV